MAAIQGSLRFQEQGGEMVVRVTVEPNATTLIVVKHLVVGQPGGAVAEALRVARDEVDRHRRRTMLHLVPEATC